MPLSKLLVTSDLSDEAARPFPVVAALAKSLSASVVLLFVYEEPIVAPLDVPMAPPLQRPPAEAAVAEARKRLHEQAQVLRAKGIEVEAEVITAAQVAPAIVDHAREHGMDWIALSTHGRTGFRRMVMGSVAESVLRRAHVPVLVFPRHE
jgi:nucleotide-binding universal stress UspA family protein